MNIRLSKTGNERILMQKPFVDLGRALSNGKTRVDIRTATPEILMEMGPRWYEEVPEEAEGEGKAKKKA